MTSLPNSRAINFVGRIAEKYTPGSFPKENFVFEGGEGVSDGNWLFATFDHPDVLGLRVGYQSGSIDRTDYGGDYQDDFLQLHIEVVTREKTLSWIASGKYSSRQVESSLERFSIRLQGEGKEIFKIEDWPNPKFVFNSDDGRISVDFSLDIPWIVLLPDFILSKIVFGMWWTAGPLRANVRLDERKYALSGSYFYDHARISCKTSAEAPLGMYLYTPIRFDDGSVFVSYYSEDCRSEKIEYYSFGMLMDKNGTTMEWYRHLDLVDITFDTDGIPANWELAATNSSSGLKLRMSSISPKAFSNWGSDGLPKKRAHYKYLPNVFTCNAEFEHGSIRRSMNGSGVSEYFLVEQ